MCYTVGGLFFGKEAAAMTAEQRRQEILTLLEQTDTPLSAAALAHRFSVSRQIVNKYRTIPIHIQYLRGSYGTVDMGATMALIMLSIVPVIIFYLCCQKHIIKGVAAGAVKG